MILSFLINTTFSSYTDLISGVLQGSELASTDPSDTQLIRSTQALKVVFMFTFCFLFSS